MTNPTPCFPRSSSRKRIGVSATISACVAVLAAAACGDVPVTDDASSVAQPIGDTPATDGACIDACGAAADCGILATYGVSPDHCFDICMASYTNEDAQWAQSADCGELEQAILDGGAPELSPCTEACEKMETCDLLDPYGIDLAECFDVCSDQYTAAEVSWAIGASCGALEQALEANPPASPCVQVCDKLDTCGVLQVVNVSIPQCLGLCGGYPDGEVTWALNASCAELHAALGN